MIYRRVCMMIYGVLYAHTYMSAQVYSTCPTYAEADHLLGPHLSTSTRVQCANPMIDHGNSDSSLPTIVIFAAVMLWYVPHLELSLTLPHWPQLHHCLSTTFPQREHSQNAGPVGAGGGLLLAPLVLFLKETILAWLRSTPRDGRSGRLVVVVPAVVVRARFAALSFRSSSANCRVTPSGLSVPHASQLRWLGGLWSVHIAQLQPFSGGGLDDSAVGGGLGLSVPHASQLRHFGGL